MHTQKLPFHSLFLLCLSVITPFEVFSDTLPPNDAGYKHQINRGKLVYDRFCALCHGKNLEGQANWRTRKSNNRLPAPPHDETGHTWHHADALLFGIIKKGLVPPYAPKDYETDMPAWGDTLQDDDIWAVLAYIKSRWPKETKKIQADINQDSKQ